jgi:hypothetical protein
MILEQINHKNHTNSTKVWFEFLLDLNLLDRYFTDSDDKLVPRGSSFR